MVKNKVTLMLFLSMGLCISVYAEAKYDQAIPGKPHSQSMKFVEVYAHRGDRAFAPENVLPAYKTSFEVGTDWIDMDVGVSKDGVLIVSHDPYLNPDIMSKDGKFAAKSKNDFLQELSKDGNLDKNIQPYLYHNLTLKQIQLYEAGVINPQSPYASYFPEQTSVPGTHIPTLQNVIGYSNKIGNNKVFFQIEFKDKPDHPDWTVTPAVFAQKMYDFLDKNNLFKRTEIQSFNWQILYDLQSIAKKHGKHVNTAYLTATDVDKLNHDSDPKIAGLWTGGKLLKDYNNSYPTMIKALGGNCYEPEDVMLTKEDVDLAHKLGLKVVPWRWPEHTGTAFDTPMAEKLISWGVDGLIVDDPGRLTSILAAKGYNVPKRIEVK